MQWSLEAIRRAKKIPQQTLADVCGVHVNTYSTWEKNPGKIPIDSAIKIADFLGVSLKELFG